MNLISFFFFCKKLVHSIIILGSEQYKSISLVIDFWVIGGFFIPRLSNECFKNAADFQIVGEPAAFIDEALTKKFIFGIS